jgi:hypothetical protein
MAQILKVRKKVRKTSRGACIITIQDKELKKYEGKEVVVRVAVE